MEIIKMNAAHIPAVAALERECFSAPWSEKSLIEELENPLSCWLVAVDGDTVLGYVGSQSVLGESDMMNLAVSTEHRRQGVAEALVLALIEELKQAGNHCLTLEVRASNTPAKMLYEKLGFLCIGVRPKYYQKPIENAEILRKEWSI